MSLLCTVHADQDALPIIEKAFAAAETNYAIARSYVFNERIEERRLNKKGEVKKTESTTHDVTLLDDSEYRRLIAINDLPLYAKSAAKEQKKLEKQIRKMQNETPGQRKKRLARVEKNREESREFLEEITKAFDFKLMGEEEVSGVMTHVISAEPRAGYIPSSREAKMLTKLRGTLWIARNSHAWVKADIETFEAIRFALIFKLREGARIRFTQRQINDEVWLTENWSVRFKARALVVKAHRELSGSYSNFRKFTTGSSIVPER
jgi:hypothetical protein